MYNIHYYFTILLGCLDAGKTGKENAAAIKDRLKELGLDRDSVDSY